MIIRAEGDPPVVTIVEPDNFKAFAVALPQRPADLEQARHLLGDLVSRVEGEHLWIAEDALRGWPALAGQQDWQDGLTKMFAAVTRFGWYDPSGRVVRAHVVPLQS